ncbi:hypothetical protein ABZ743_32460 [Streptomyces sp. NPDC006662]|uniref:hypothetical protein n=1 Tax=Streptomyces sp. NPDC006662 TaxID=3156902 RepID=UPI0033C0B642
MSGLHARRLEKLRMVWSLADERFQESLEAATAYYWLHWRLRAPAPRRCRTGRRGGGCPTFAAPGPGGTLALGRASHA